MDMVIPKLDFWLVETVLNQIKTEQVRLMCITHEGTCPVFRLVDNSGDLKSGLVWVQNGQKEVGLRMVQISKGSEIQKPNHLDSDTFGQKLFEIRTKSSGF